MKRKRNKTMKQKKKKPIFCWQKKCEKGCLVVKKKEERGSTVLFCGSGVHRRGKEKLQKKRKKKKKRKG